MNKQCILIVSDINFENNVKDLNDFREKLNTFINAKCAPNGALLYSVTGKYCYDNTLTLIEIDDKNKTVFIKSILDHINKFNDVFIISNYTHEVYLEGLRKALNQEDVQSTVFWYEDKSNVKK